MAAQRRGAGAGVASGSSVIEAKFVVFGDLAQVRCGCSCEPLILCIYATHTPRVYLLKVTTLQRR